MPIANVISVYPVYTFQGVIIRRFHIQKYSIHIFLSITHYYIFRKHPFFTSTRQINGVLRTGNCDSHGTMQETLIEVLPRILWLCCVAPSAAAAGHNLLSSCSYTQSSSGHRPELDKLYSWHLDFPFVFIFLFLLFFNIHFEWGKAHSVYYPSS